MDWMKLRNGSDIRGIAEGENATLSPEAARAVAAAFARELGVGARICVGHDPRRSSAALSQAVIEGLCAEGAEVLDLGLGSTPAMFCTTLPDGLDADGAIMVTASHLPAEYNGLKFFNKKGGLEGSDIGRLLASAMDKGAKAGVAQAKASDFMHAYAEGLKRVILSAAGRENLEGVKIAVDAGSGSGGFFAKDVLAPLGADVSGSQLLEPDGDFPGHIPNPENAVALKSACDMVKRSGADWGVIFDTDVDRAALISGDGREIGRGRLIALSAAMVLRESAGAVIVTDSVTPRSLTRFIEGLGGVHHRFRRGYKNVINEMIRLNSEGQNCPLAIETSGHAAFSGNYNLDDGAYLAAKLLGFLIGHGGASALDGYGEPSDEIDIRIPILAPNTAEVGRSALEGALAYAKAHGWKLSEPNYEGVRVEFDDGMFLLRMSLHEPLMPLYAESDAPNGARAVAARALEALQGCKDIDVASVL